MSLAEPRPYHHGDLRRALLAAARQLLEAEGPDALSLRAVAREAGVSPAAPYHHFRDKSELLAAVADQGFEELADQMRRARAVAIGSPERITAVGAAYVLFALDHGALYRVMTGSARAPDGCEITSSSQGEVVALMRETIIEASAPGASEADLELNGVAALAALHGLADISTFKFLEPLKTRLGGEETFLRETMRHLGVFAGKPPA